MPESDDRAWTAAGIDPAAYAGLARGLAPTRVWSLLMAVMEQRAAQRTPAQLMDQWARGGFTKPSYVDQRALVELDGHVLVAGSGFEAIVQSTYRGLTPVKPGLGSDPR